jgi:two-component system, OmpR family, heavy metal sensor histidine kinase CusS
VNVLPIRLRLSLWYAMVLCVTTAVMAAIIGGTVLNGIHAELDEQLRARVIRLREKLGRAAEEHERILGMVSDKGLSALARENTSPSELIQLRNARGDWIYRSPEMTRAGIDRKPVGAGHFRYFDAASTLGRLRVVTADVQIGTPHYRMQMAESLARYDNARRRCWSALLVFAPVLLLLSASGAYWLSARALAPIDAIAQRALAISGQNLGERVPVPPAHDEVRRLAETINAMLVRIEAAFQRITQFTADASHELRAPLAAIRTAAEIAGRRSRSEAEYRQHFAEIVTETDNTAKLVESLLAIARADSGYGLRSETVDLARIAAEVCSSARRIADEKGIVFASTIQPGPLQMTGDAEAIRRLLVAVVDNAMKYTERGGRVEVMLFSESGHLVISVADTGIGISEADLPHIFDRFYRADKVRSRAVGGAGLGLAIARWIAEAHRGSITCTSSHGFGSTFEIRVPITTRFRLQG